MSAPVYSDQDKVACLRREIAMRRVVYPGRVASGSMTEAEAQREIGIMVQIADEIEARFAPRMI